MIEVLNYRTVVEHILNIFFEGELEENSVVGDFRIEPSFEEF